MDVHDFDPASPLTDPRSARTGPSPASPAPHAPAEARPRRVLVVDDNADSATSLALLVECDGHRVVTAFDGSSALEQAADLRPELVLLDLGLGDMSGYQLAEELRRSLGPDPVLVAVTGSDRESVIQRCRGAGIDGHIQKPIADFAALREMVRTLDFAATAGRS